MKAITLTQPWATLVASGEKQVETRSWKTSYRGPLAIHAAKGFPEWARELCETDSFEQSLWSDPCNLVNLRDETAEDEMFPPPVWQFLPTGCVVAVCSLVDVYPTEEVLPQVCIPPKPPYRQAGALRIRAKEIAFGDYSPGRFAWVLENIRALPEPVRAKGALSLWEWNTSGIKVPL